jgi:hypothetical protein
VRDVAATARAARAQCRGESARLIAKAQKALALRFDLLGYEGLSFGDPIDWMLDPVNGVRAPAAHWSQIRYLDPSVAGDHKVVWELNRHQWLVTLAQAWALTGEKRYADAIATHLDAWQRLNPPGIGVNWASSLEVAYRAVAWVWALGLIRDSGAISPALYAQTMRSAHQHAHHLECYLSTYFSPNTHLTGEALGLLYLGVGFAELRGAARWRDVGLSILARELNRQVCADGVYFERATYYHRYTADIYLHALLLARASGLPLPATFDTRLGALVDHLAAIQRPDGLIPLVGDDDGGRLISLDGRPGNDPRGTLALASRMLRTPRQVNCLVTEPMANILPSAVGEDHGLSEALWTLGPEALSRHESTPDADRSPAAFFPAGGFVVTRDRWGARGHYLLLSARPGGTSNAGHAHDDLLAIEVCAHGVPMLVDPGTFGYTATPAWRESFRGGAAHNTLSIANERRAVARGPFSWTRLGRAASRRWISEDRFDYYEGCAEGISERNLALEHHRSVFHLRGDYWVVKDALHNSTADPVIELTFQAPPQRRIETVDEGRVAIAGGDGAHRARLDVIAIAGHAGSGAFRVEQSWASSAYGRKTPAWRAVWRGVLGPGSSMLTILQPLAEDEAGWECSPIPTPKGMAVELRKGERVDHVAVDGADVPGMTADASFVWQTRAPGQPHACVAIDARRLLVADREVMRTGTRVSWVEARIAGPDAVIRMGEPVARSSGGRR